MTVITVVGLGPGDPELLTQEGRQLLTGERLYVRTGRHPALQHIPVADRWTSFDPIIEAIETTNPAHAVADALLGEAEASAVIYAVPGHPFEDATVHALLERAETDGSTVRVIPGIGWLDVVRAITGPKSISGGVQVVDALAVLDYQERRPFAGGTFPISPLQPAVVTNLQTPRLIAAVRDALPVVYPASAPAMLMSAFDLDAGQARRIAIGELDPEMSDPPAALYLPPVDPLVSGRTAEALQTIVARLRAPSGCPWDREQTHASLKRHLVEEAYEVLDAIDQESTPDLAEELGDLLLQVYLHAQISEEASEFTLEDIFETLTAKLVRRHPHVFGDVSADTASSVVQQWDRIKREERAEKGEEDRDDPFGRVPPDLPALARAQVLLRRAMRLGVDLPHPEQSSRSDWEVGSPISDAQELARALVTLVAAANRAGIDAEGSLRAWTREFERYASDTATVASSTPQTRKPDGQGGAT